jgi:hypothetical protein
MVEPRGPVLGVEDWRSVRLTIDEDLGMGSPPPWVGSARSISPPTA